MNKILCIFCENELIRISSLFESERIIVCNRCLISDAYYRVYIVYDDNQVNRYIFKFVDGQHISADRKDNFTDINDHRYKIFIDLDLNNLKYSVEQMKNKIQTLKAFI